MAPAGLWLVVFMVVPLAILFVFSLGSRTDTGQFQAGFTLNNYLRFVSGPYLLALGRSLLLAASTTVICLALGFACASWLAFNVDKRKQNLFLTLLVAPLWTSFLLRIYAWITILRPEGLLTAFWQNCGIESPAVLLYTPWAVLLGMVYNYLPFMILPLYATLEKLDKRLLEAASDLGASPLQVLRHILIPLSAPGIVTGVVVVFVPALGDYVTPDLLGGAKTAFIGNLIQNQFLTVRDWAFGSAVSTILIAIVALAIFIYLRYGEKNV